MSETYVQFAPVPYSAVRMDVPPVFDDDGMDYDATAAGLAMAWAALMAAFPAAEEGGGAPSANGAAASAQRGGAGTGVWCQEHRAECTQSPRKMQGGEYDVFMHKFPAGETGPQGGAYHTVYFRETVDVNGESNDGRELPPTVKQPPVEAQAARADDDPGPSEPNF